MPFDITVPAAGSDVEAGMDLLYSETVGSSGATTIDTGTLPTGYKALIVQSYCRTDAAGVSLDAVKVHFNGDSNSGPGGNYILVYQYGGNINGGGVGNANRSTILFATGASADANFFNVGQMVIPQHENTIGYKAATATSSRICKSGSDRITYNSAMVWQNTAAITTITFTSLEGGDFVEGSGIFVYGVK